MKYYVNLVDLTRITAVLQIHVEKENESFSFISENEEETKKTVTNITAQVLEDIRAQQKFKFDITNIYSINIVSLKESEITFLVSCLVENNDEIMIFLKESLSKLYKDNVIPEYMIKTLETENGVDSILDLVTVIYRISRELINKEEKSKIVIASN